MKILCEPIKEHTMNKINFKKENDTINKKGAYII